jgi:hydrogenase nickel incorporation protein HypA/HybF
LHEWALAEAVVAATGALAEREGLREVAGIKVRLGELQQIDREIFEMALRELIDAGGTRLRGARAEVEIEEAGMKCRACGRRWGVAALLGGLGRQESEAIHFIPEMARVHARCPGCAGPDFEVVAGRGVWLASVEGFR